MEKFEWSLRDTIHSVLDWGKLLVEEVVAGVDTRAADAINGPEDSL